MTITTAPQRTQWRRLATVWVAAYALVLQLVLSPFLMAPAHATDGGQSALFELCLDHVGAPTPDGAPSTHHDLHCNLCVHGGLAFVAVPPVVAAWSTPVASVAILWAVIDNPVAEAAGFAGKQARGPPLLA